MGVGDLEEGRLLLEVDRQGILVSGGEGIALGRIEKIGGRSGDGFEAFLGIEIGDGGEKSPRIGMLGVVEDLVDGTDLHDLSGIHDGDPVGHVGDDAQVMGDEDDGHVALLLEPVDQLEDLRLDGDVQGRGRLVADEDFRIGGQGDGDDDSLTHAAGEFERILIEADLRLGNADLAHDLDGPRLGGLSGQADVGGVFPLQILFLFLIEGNAGVELLFLEGDLFFGDDLARRRLAGADGLGKSLFLLADSLGLLRCEFSLLVAVKLDLLGLVFSGLDSGFLLSGLEGILQSWGVLMIVGLGLLDDVLAFKDLFFVLDLLLGTKSGDLRLRLLGKRIDDLLLLGKQRIVLLHEKELLLGAMKLVLKRRDPVFVERIGRIDEILGPLDLALETDLPVVVGSLLLGDELLAIDLDAILLDEHGFGDLLSDLLDGVEGRKGILEDHADLVAADTMEFAFGDLREILPFIEDVAVLDDGGGRKNAHDGLGRDGLSGARLADDAKRLATMEIEGDAANGMDESVVRLEGDFEVLNGKDRFLFFVGHISRFLSETG